MTETLIVRSSVSAHRAPVLSDTSEERPLVDEGAARTKTAARLVRRHSFLAASQVLRLAPLSEHSYHESHVWSDVLNSLHGALFSLSDPWSGVVSVPPTPGLAAVSARTRDHVAAECGRLTTALGETAASCVTRSLGYAALGYYGLVCLDGYRTAFRLRQAAELLARSHSAFGHAHPWARQSMQPSEVRAEGGAALPLQVSAYVLYEEIRMTLKAMGLDLEGFLNELGPRMIVTPTSSTP